MLKLTKRDIQDISSNRAFRKYAKHFAALGIAGLAWIMINEYLEYIGRVDIAVGILFVVSTLILLYKYIKCNRNLEAELLREQEKE